MATIDAAKNTAVLRILAPLAKEANTKLATADKKDAESFDARLAACIALGKAKGECDQAKVTFKEWCVQNITKGYETARKLAAIGQKPDPRAALEAMRAENAAANREQRAKAPKATRKSGSAAADAAGGGDSPAIANEKAQGIRMSAHDVTMAYIESMDSMVREGFLRRVCEHYGYAIERKPGARAVFKIANDPKTALTLN